MRFLFSLLISFLALVVFSPNYCHSITAPTPLADPSPDSSFTSAVSALFSDDLSFVDRRILLKIKKPDGHSHYSVEEVAEMKKNFLQWMSLNLLPDSPPLTPSQFIDVYWHEFILFTEKYHQWCHKHFGTFIHHFPEDSEEGLPAEEGIGDGLSMTKEQREENNERVESIQSGWEVTRELMKKYWGEEWEGEGDKGGCGKCSAGKCSGGKNETTMGGCGSCSAKKGGCGNCHGKRNTRDNKNMNDSSALIPSPPSDAKSSCGSCSTGKNSTTTNNNNSKKGGCGSCHGKKASRGSCGNCKSKKASNDDNKAAGCGNCHAKKSHKGSEMKKEKHDAAGCGKCHGKKDKKNPAGCGNCHGKKDMKNPAGCGSCHGKKQSSVGAGCGNCHAKKEQRSSPASCGKCHGKKDSSIKGSCGNCKAKKESMNPPINKASCGKCSSKKEEVAVL